MQSPGATYHVMSRGNGKQNIYLEDADRLRFLERLSDVVDDCGWRIFAYCLMDNHYHLLLETPRANLATGMKNLNSAYALWFNCRHRRVGHVMQGRYHSPLVETDNHFLELSRYIALNPVRSGLLDRPEHYRWSSFAALAGIYRPGSFLDTTRVLEFFSGDPLSAREEYKRFVYDGLERDRALAAESQRLKALRVTLDELFPLECNRESRNAQIRKAFFDHGYKLSEIATHLGVHCSTVGRALKRYS